MRLVTKLALQVPQIRRLWIHRLNLEADVADLRARLAAPAIGDSPFFHYHSGFNAQDLIRKYALPDQLPTPGMLTNFLGVKIPPEDFPGILDGREGEVEGVPISANWHADIAEWAAALSAVDEATGSFRIIELGCGWGCWLNNMGAAARSRGLELDPIGIEGDEGHVESARRILAINGFTEADYRVVHGIAASSLV